MPLINSWSRVFIFLEDPDEMYVACEANLFGDFLHGKAIPFHDFLRLVYAEAVHVFHDPHAIFFFKHLRYVRGADIYLF